MNKLQKILCNLPDSLGQVLLRHLSPIYMGPLRSLCFQDTRMHKCTEFEWIPVATCNFQLARLRAYICCRCAAGIRGIAEHGHLHMNNASSWYTHQISEACPSSICNREAPLGYISEEATLEAREILPLIKF